MKMQVFVVVVVALAMGVAKRIFHAAAAVGHGMQQAVFVEGIEGAVQRYPVEFMHQRMLQLGLRHGTMAVDNKIEHLHAGIGLPQRMCL